jgi:1,3-beta-glucanosyltransferase GAS1
MRGIVYVDSGRTAPRPGTFVDALVDRAGCARDLPYLQKLGVNTLVVRDLRSDADHGACMRVFETAGIYILALIDGAVSDGGASASEVPYIALDRSLTEYALGQVDALHGFKNFLGIIVALDDFDSFYVQRLALRKALVRDTKAHIKSRGYRTIPVGTVGANHGTTSVPDFLSCGTSDGLAADFYMIDGMIDSADSCKDSSWDTEKLLALYQNNPTPILLEYSCKKENNSFSGVPALYGDRMAQVFSGGFAYSWFDGHWNHTRKNQVAEIKGESVKTLAGFDLLSSQLAQATPVPTQIDQYVPANTPSSTCRPLAFSDFPDLQQNLSRSLELSPILPPTPSKKLCECMMQSLGCIADANAASGAELCNPSVCAALGGNTTSGDYASYFQCNKTEHVSWIYNRIYLSQNKTDAACSSVGGLLQQATPSTSLSSGCRNLLRQAGPDGTGKITSFAETVPKDDRRSGDNGRMKAGIGGGIAAIVAVIGAMIFFWCRVRRTKTRLAAQAALRSPVSPATESSEFQKVELPDTSIERPEIASTEVYELGEEAEKVFEARGDDVDLRHEAPEGNIPVELAADSAKDRERSRERAANGYS